MSEETLWGQTGKDAVLHIQKTKDFALTGGGSTPNWEKADWVTLPQLTKDNKSRVLKTRTKVLYSNTGMYFLFECEDQILNATMDADFMKLWNEDVVEIFLWPDESDPVYLEYELSPLNHELPLLVSNKNGNLALWTPFVYEGNRKTRHITTVKGGEKKSKAAISQWSAEVFIPYELMRPLHTTPPKTGTRWRANLYRIDYDMGETLFTWQPNSGDFHEYKKFGTFLFE